MTVNENQLNSAVEPAPEQESTAAPESVETTTPETEGEKAPEKTFTQEELDKIIAREKAKIERKVKREMAQTPQVQQPVSSESVTPEQFETYEEYAEALAEVKAQEKLREREVQAQRSKIDQAFDDRVEAAMDKYDDFQQVAFNSNLPVSDTMAEAIKESELGPDVLYWLGQNPKEAARIFQMSPLQQAKEIGKIEVKVSAEPPAKKTTSAPDPITPVTSRQANVPSYDTTDPRSTKTMSDSEWIAAENQRMLRKMQPNR